MLPAESQGERRSSPHTPGLVRAQFPRAGPCPVPRRRPGWPGTPHVSSLQLTTVNGCKGTRHPATAGFTLEKTDLTETVCKHRKTNFCKLPGFSHLSPSVREVKVRLRKHRKLLCIPSSRERAVWLLHGMPCGRFASPNISSEILCSSASLAAIFQQAPHTLPGEASGVLCAAAEKLLPVLRSPTGYLQKA